MLTTRREFLKQISVGVASLTAAWMLEGCQAAGISTATARAAPTPTSNFQSPTANPGVDCC